MNLVDEEDDAALTACHLADDALEALLELALVLRTGHQRTHVERIDLLILQILRHIATDDTACQALYDGGLTRARLANEDRIVLRAARQDLQQTAYLVVAADDRVELAGTCHADQVLGVFLQRLIVVVGALRLHLLALTQLEHGLLHVLLIGASILQNTAHGRVHFEESH